MSRIFIADGREHPDPDPTLSIKKVRDMMADFLPDLAGAAWTETARGEDNLIEFNRRVGTKGTSPHKFEMGRLVMTSNFEAQAHEAVGETATMEGIATIIRRHGSGDWGELGAEDIASNNAALIEGNRLLSSYTDFFPFKVWVITEWDRSVTTILLPEDY
jgi:PRTRC genetic system protein C